MPRPDTQAAQLLAVCVSCAANAERWPEMTQVLTDAGVRRFVFLVGDPTLDVPWRLDGAQLRVRCDDGYAGLPHKTLLLARAVVEDPAFADVREVWKLDDDVRVHPPGHDVIGGLAGERGDYRGGQVRSPLRNDRDAHLGRCPGSPWDTRLYTGRYEWYCWGGASYVLSRRTLTLLVRHLVARGLQGVAEDDIYEDVMVGRVLHDHGVRPTRSDVLARHVIADALHKPWWMRWVNRHVANVTYTRPGKRAAALRAAARRDE